MICRLPGYSVVQSHGSTFWGPRPRVRKLRGSIKVAHYPRLLFEDLQPDARISLRRGLLRYCELDTLAMGLVLQSWLHG